MRAAGSTAPAATRPSPAKPRGAYGGIARMKPRAGSAIVKRWRALRAASTVCAALRGFRRCDPPTLGRRCAPPPTKRPSAAGAAHKAHRFDTRHAAVEACLGCYDDAHSRAYRASPHGRLWMAERAGRDAPGSGVSCATCHMPREAHQREGHAIVRVQHNQNRNLRPNEKMVRSVCLNCHGLGFSLAALGSPRLVARNFGGRPLGHIRGLRMARARLIEANTR